MSFNIVGSKATVYREAIAWQEKQSKDQIYVKNVIRFMLKSQRLICSTKG